MHFLVDEQLPADLVVNPESAGWQAVHVSAVLGYGATDVQVAREAERSGSVLITKDADFIQKSASGAIACPIVWVRIGNIGNRALWEKLRPVLPRIAAELREGARVVQVV